MGWIALPALLVVMTLGAMACGTDSRAKPDSTSASVSKGASPAESTDQAGKEGVPRTRREAGGGQDTRSGASESWTVCVAGPDCTPTPQKTQPLSRYPGYEAVTWERALQWWPYRPVFRAQSLPRPSWEERVFAVSNSGGVKGDPEREFAILAAVYQYPPATADKRDYFGILDGGGWIFQIVRHKPGEPVRFIGKGKPVRVRGQMARIWVVRKSEGSSQNFRRVFWEKENPDGSILQFDFGNSPLVYSDAETIDVIERLLEVN